MKKLYLVRHAKSSWDFPHLSDHDRPLNKRGNRDAPRMAQHLVGLIDPPAVFVCSTSKRTNETAVPFLEVFHHSNAQMIQEEQLYHADRRDFIRVISQLYNHNGSAMLFSHNPGITFFVNHLTGSDIYNIPTCGVAGVSLDIDDWAAFDGTGGTLDFYYYPKGL